MFADNPSGSDDDPNADESAGRTYLLHQANVKETTEPDAETVEPVRLLERAASIRNLSRALLNVARNKGAPGIDGQSVREVVEHAPEILAALKRALIAGTYLPGDIRRVWIPKSGGGQRGLGIPNVVDRVVQQAVHQVLAPVFEPLFHDSSHGFRPGRGAQTAISEATGYLAEGYSTTVDIDLSKFFDRVNHQRLLNRLAQHIDDGRILKLIHRMLKARVVLPDGTSVSSEEGAPQGGPLSPILSNVVLDELDWELERRGLRFVRYADDFSVFVRSKRAGQRVMNSVRRFIERRLRLVVNEDKSSVSEPFDLTFLGFHLSRNSKGEIAINVSDRTKQRMNLRIRELTPRSWGSSVADCLGRLNRYLNGWIGYFQLCTKVGMYSLSTFDAHIRRRVRAIIVCHKKRPRHLFRHLLRRGVPRGLAWKAVYGVRGHWKRSATFGVHKAYSNAWFSERLISLRQRWEELQPAPSAPKQLLLF